jgi:hypothetical protein
MAWCEANGVDFIFGLARNVRFNRAIGAELVEARDESRASGQPARRFKKLTWSTLKSWSRKRRVIVKVEWTKGEANPRFIVTSLTIADGDGRHPMKWSTARTARWRTASRNARWTCSPTARPLTP